MKKYFAKYLPVEDEIKEGDNFIIDVYNSHQYGIKTALVVGYDIIRSKEGFPQVYPFDKNKCKKVELFLCSRDIQVGDTITRTDLLEPKIMIYDGTPSYKLAKEWVKIIGKISPEAKWVKIKEGNEFDEEEIKNMNIN